jgi:hypothetical protein
VPSADGTTKKPLNLQYNLQRIAHKETIESPIQSPLHRKDVDFEVFFGIILEYLSFELSMELCLLPNDVIKQIISYCPRPLWFILCKRFTPLASQAISPLNYRKRYLLLIEEGPLRWAIRNNKIIAFSSLLCDNRIVPPDDVIVFACKCGTQDIVQLLLQGTKSYWRFNRVL